MKILSITLLCFLSLSSAVMAQDDKKQESKFTNALVNESSPYLLMHAHNPVNWYPWNEDTLALARKEDKPIFLSIGYSSCHWCHVMERESFLDEEIANFLNEHYICIKVDREERPDVDEIYMQALMEIKRGGGGWPLSMFMTPDAKPFFGGTYWPARDGDRNASVGFLTVIQKIEEHYRKNRQLVEKDAETVTSRTRTSMLGLVSDSGTTFQRSWIKDCVSELESTFDPRFGGFRFSVSDPKVPKFPEPPNLFFLIDQLKRAEDRSSDRSKKLEKMLITTCEGMMKGGIYDHLGGGFHRYSVDRYWRIPHFEKMLYDNGQLATVYAEVYELTGREEFKNVVDGICGFIERELVADNGGIYSSLDAESEGVEGKFYRWELDEIKSALDEVEYELFAAIYGLNKPPNFEDKYYAPQLSKRMQEHASERSLSLSELENKLRPIRRTLFDIREKRIRPLLDTKILAAWNGLMIRGLADAGRILDNNKYTQMAANAAEFVLNEMVNDEGRLFRTHTDGKSKLNAYVIDHACMVNGLIGLHMANGDQKWLDAAVRLQKKQDELFWDSKNKGYFYTSKDHEVLIARTKRTRDGVMPSGNSLAAENLLYLGRQLKNEGYVERSKSTILSTSAMLTRIPYAATRMLPSVEEFLNDK
ncbi:MAG: thioredoxin domain-containing protein [Planctomycetota bacterium]